METQPTTEEFFERCFRHDWFYMMSDDHRVYTRGIEAERKLENTIAAAGENRELFTSIYKAWHDYFFNGKSWGTEKPSVPQLGDCL